MTIQTLEQIILYFLFIEALATNRLDFADSSNTCRTLFYMKLKNIN